MDGINEYEGVFRGQEALFPIIEFFFDLGGHIADCLGIESKIVQGIQQIGNIFGGGAFGIHADDQILDPFHFSFSIPEQFSAEFSVPVSGDL
jgi:hypothetical protein